MSVTDGSARHLHASISTITTQAHPTPAVTENPSNVDSTNTLASKDLGRADSAGLDIVRQGLQPQACTRCSVTGSSHASGCNRLDLGPRGHGGAARMLQLAVRQALAESQDALRDGARGQGGAGGRKRARARRSDGQHLQLVVRVQRRGTAHQHPSQAASVRHRHPGQDDVPGERDPGGWRSRHAFRLQPRPLWTGHLLRLALPRAGDDCGSSGRRMHDLSGRFQHHYGPRELGTAAARPRHGQPGVHARLQSGTPQPASDGWRVERQGRLAPGRKGVPCLGTFDRRRPARRRQGETGRGGGYALLYARPRRGCPDATKHPHQHPAQVRCLPGHHLRIVECLHVRRSNRIFPRQSYTRSSVVSAGGLKGSGIERTREGRAVMIADCRPSRRGCTGASGRQSVAGPLGCGRVIVLTLAGWHQ
ncbi:hypothetical protein L1887_48878 [Cichorium endivia]|nr:hypothetical protein L1887_48878 [Cichorium endivia]